MTNVKHVWPADDTSHVAAEYRDARAIASFGYCLLLEMRLLMENDDESAVSDD